MATPFTKITSEILEWSPLQACDSDARWVWISLLISREMRRTCPGLLVGSVGLVAEIAKLPFARAVAALEELVARDLIEHDQAHRVIRYTRFPSRIERPMNGSHLVRWWKGFEDCPACPARDRHVATVTWLCEPLTKDFEKVWPTTFGTMQINSGTYQGVSTTSSQRSIPTSQVTLWDSDTLTEGVGHSGRHPTSYFLPSSEGGVGGEAGQTSATGSGAGEPPPPEPAGPLPDQPAFWPEGTSPGTRPPAPAATGARGAVTPLLTGPGILERLHRSSGGRFPAVMVDDRLKGSLTQVARQCAEKGVSWADVDLAGEFLRAGGAGYRSDFGASWAVRAGAVLDLVAQARAWQEAGRPGYQGRRDPLAAGVPLERGPEAPRPPEQFINGKREL